MLTSFLKKYLGGPNEMDVDKLKTEYEKVKEENTKLKSDVEGVKVQVFSLNLNNSRFNNCKMTTSNNDIYIKFITVHNYLK